LNYIDEIAKDIGDRCGMMMSAGSDALLLRIYAVLCLVKGTKTSREDVHDAWSAWTAGMGDPKHRSLIPFDELSAHMQELDATYQDAIVAVAARLAL